MGFFRRNFDKPGPGVRKDEPRKKGAARFFELLFRDFGDLVKLNLLFFLTVLPSALVFVIGIFWLHIGVALLLSLVLAFPVGGAVVAYVYYITKMMRDEPSYVWYEFKRKFKENFRQAAPIGMLCTAFIYAQILIWSTFFSALTAGEPVGDFIWYFLTILAIVVFLMIAPYIFLHFAYIDLKTSQVIKNSVLMAFGFILRSFMCALVGGVIWMVFALFWPVLFPVIILFGMSLSMLLGLMWVWPPFNKHFKVEETLIKKLDEADES